MDQVTTKLQDKQEHCSQLESHLKEYKEKHLSLEQKTEELECQIKVCIKETVAIFSTAVAMEMDDLEGIKDFKFANKCEVVIYQFKKLLVVFSCLNFGFHLYF